MSYRYHYSYIGKGVFLFHGFMYDLYPIPNDVSGGDTSI